MFKKEDYNVWFNPATNEVRFILRSYSYIPRSCGNIEVSNLSLKTEEEAEMFLMLYPGADTINIGETIAIWGNLEGELKLSLYSRKRIDVEIMKGSLVYNPPGYV